MIKFGKKIVDVEERLPAFIQVFSQQKDLLAIYLFGSRAQDIADELSDIDIALLYNEYIPFERELNLIGEVTSLLCTDEVSLVILNNVPLVFQYGIISDARILYCSDTNARYDFEERVIKKYIDFQYYLNSYDQEFISVMKKD